MVQYDGATSLPHGRWQRWHPWAFCHPSFDLREDDLPTSEVRCWISIHRRTISLTREVPNSSWSGRLPNKARRTKMRPKKIFLLQRTHIHTAGFKSRNWRSKSNPVVLPEDSTAVPCFPSPKETSTHERGCAIHLLIRLISIFYIFFA